MNRSEICSWVEPVYEKRSAMLGSGWRALGLARRRLARDQGGDLVCHEREGGGAAFVLTLPTASDGEAPQKEPK